MRWIVLVMLVGGCSSTLETGYMPRKLGSSEEVRRGFYAEKFSPEEQASKDYERRFGSSGSGAAGGAGTRIGR